MNNKLICLGALSLFMISGSFAQAGTKPKGQRQAKARTIDAADIQTALKGMTLSAEQSAKVSDLVKEFLTGVNGTLTPEQQDQLKTALEKAIAPKSPADNLITSLSAAVTLTPEQELKIKPLVEDTLKAMRDKTKGLETNERKQVTEQSMSDLKTALRSVLTTDQQAKLDDWKPSMRGRAQGQPGPGAEGKKPGKP
jgi:Spy/CpxP family protein refolding chaperone